MDKLKKFLKYLIFALIILVFLSVGFVKMALPMVAKAEVIKIEVSKERIERGKYLANSVCVCMDCHSQRDWNKFAGPLKAGTLGMGGEEFNQEMGFPGRF